MVQHHIISMCVYILYSDELHTLRQKYSQLATENESLGKQLETAHQEAKVATDNATTLKGN